MNFSNNSATLSYSRSARPNYVGAGVPMIVNVFALSAIQKIDQQWQLAESASYAHRSGGSGLNSLTYNSYRVGVDLYYWVPSIWSTALSYDYTKFPLESGSFTQETDRQAITLSVRAVWG